MCGIWQMFKTSHARVRERDARTGGWVDSKSITKGDRYPNGQSAG